LLRVHRGILAVVCSGVALASVPLACGQDATSANLSGHLETGEATPARSPDKNKTEPIREIESSIPAETAPPVTDETPAPDEPAVAGTPMESKARTKRRPTPAVRTESASSSAPTQLSLAAAQALALSAPLPEYPYQARQVSGTGICVMLVDTASGKVTNAMMAQSTGNAILDKVTTETFRRWRFKPGTVSQVRVPITYE
jgi:TonB family protein